MPHRFHVKIVNHLVICCLYMAYTPASLLSSYTLIGWIYTGLAFPKAVVLKIQKLWGWGPAVCPFKPSRGVSGARSSLGTIAVDKASCVSTLLYLLEGVNSAGVT